LDRGKPHSAVAPEVSNELATLMIRRGERAVAFCHTPAPADETHQWRWTVVLQAGAWSTGGYLVLVLAHALGPRAEPATPRAPVARGRQAVALALALCSLALGLVPGARCSRSRPARRRIRSRCPPFVRPSMKRRPGSMCYRFV
jgi:hypothetical protein